QASHIKPTLVIDHDMVYPPPELPGTTLIASKLLYADHYYDGALDLTAIIDRAIGPQAEQNGIYVLVLHRLHFDDLPSGGLLNDKGKVIGNQREQTKMVLQNKKAESEQAYGKAQASPP